MESTVPVITIKRYRGRPRKICTDIKIKKPLGRPRGSISQKVHQRTEEDSFKIDDEGRTNERIKSHLILKCDLKTSELYKNHTKQKCEFTLNKFMV